MDNLVTIGIDCLGTCEVKDYADMAGNDHTPPEQISWDGIQEGSIQPPDGYPVRQACRICKDPVPLNADVSIGFVGYDSSKEIAMTVADRFEEELAGKLSLDFDDVDFRQRQRAIGVLTSQRQKNRTAVFSELQKRAGSIDGLLQVLSTCIRCQIAEWP